jgi:pyruvate,water dikinase
MRTQYILNLKEAKKPRNIGTKAAALGFLIEKHFPIPTTFVCTWDGYVEFLKKGLLVFKIVKDELSKKIDENKHYAVRSSANIEDGHDYSFAGQFKSFLNVRGIDNVVQSLEDIWTSTRSSNIQVYLEKIAFDPHDLKMAVLIQEMVPPVFSGVSFSKNPITGMDEVVVEALPGSGEALLQKGITPGRWINKWGEWIVKPEEDGIQLDIIQEVVTQTRTIAKLYESDVDLEWVYDGHTIYWVQLRGITSLRNIHVYSNYIAREVFPGMIKPLVWSVNVSVVNGAWKKFFSALIGNIDIDASSLAKSFYYRAYFNMGTIGNIFETLGLPRETIELLMGIDQGGSEKPSIKLTRKMFLRLPKMLRFGFDTLRFVRRCDAFLSEVEERLGAFTRDCLDQLNERELLSEIEKLNAVMGQIAYCNIIVQLMMGLYTMILKRQLKRLGFDFESLDLTSGIDELKQFDPALHLMRLHRQYRELDEDVKEKVRMSGYSEFRQLQGINSLQEDFELFMQQFGHLSDGGNDFSKVPWRENPDAILSMITNYRNPENNSLKKVHWGDLTLPLVARWLLGPIYREARRFRLYREKISLLSMLGYDLYRAHFLALGNHFVRKQFMNNPEDLFYLSFNEVKDISVKGSGERTCTAVIAERKHEMMEYQQVTLPYVIYGDQPPPLKGQMVKKLKGIPTSRGHYRGQVKIIQGIKDFHKVEDGDVLVIPYSDVGWTPLFTKAGAIIAESGGILSHSSIIAREYNIPAVVSVPDACQLKDNMLVTVDGYQGEVIIHEPFTG